MARELSGLPRLLVICGHTRASTSGSLGSSRGRFRSATMYSRGRSGGHGSRGRGRATATGALGDEESVEHESFSEGLLEYPHYTRPREFRTWRAGGPVSGDHARSSSGARSRPGSGTQERAGSLEAFAAGGCFGLRNRQV
jgi:tRNA (guanine37-N1)-methyltransferase